jgi:hypothetical protein
MVSRTQTGCLPVPPRNEVMSLEDSLCIKPSAEEDSAQWLIACSCVAT